MEITIKIGGIKKFSWYSAKSFSVGRTIDVMSNGAELFDYHKDYIEDMVRSWIVDNIWEIDTTPSDMLEYLMDIIKDSFEYEDFSTADISSDLCICFDEEGDWYDRDIEEEE